MANDPFRCLSYDAFALVIGSRFGVETQGELVTGSDTDAL